jgi:hypothetical protein
MKKYNTRNNSLKIQKAVLGIFEDLKPRLTVRQIYYALTVKGVIPKTEGGYRQTCYQLGKMRELEIIPYGWIADNTRWQIKPRTDRSLEDALARWQSAYRRDLWDNQPDYVEIWVEKDALAGVISPITVEYDVPLYVCRGYSSMTFLYEAAEYIKELQKPAYIYHFGDFDPSGVDAAYKVRDGLLKHGADIHFERMTVTPKQIKKLKLPTRETKKKDPRSRVWGDKPSVELDAIPAPILRELVRECIERHLDGISLEVTRLIEQRERETLSEFSKNFVLGQNSDSEEP